MTARDDPLELTAVSQTVSRKPPWLKVRWPSGPNYLRLKKLVSEGSLHTVCEEALCPNIGECWGSGTATLMILGEVCTRACRFCAVKTGNPRGEVDFFEPFRVAEAVAQMGLEYVVITSVDRDDLPDGGAGVFAETVHQVKERNPDTIVEVLIPDFQGDIQALALVLEAGPHVLGQNIETVRRLTHVVRDKRAGYEQTLAVLRAAKEMAPQIYTKSAVLLGFGERPDEVTATLRDLRTARVDLLSLGQYLRPTNERKHYPLAEYVAPQRFEEYRRQAEAIGFLFVASGPLVRSSYRAWEAARLFRRTSGGLIPAFARA